MKALSLPIRKGGLIVCLFPHKGALDLSSECYKHQAHAPNLHSWSGGHDPSRGPEWSWYPQKSPDPLQRQGHICKPGHFSLWSLMLILLHGNFTIVLKKSWRLFCQINLTFICRWYFFNNIGLLLLSMKYIFKDFMLQNLLTVVRTLALIYDWTMYFRQRLLNINSGCVFSFHKTTEKKKNDLFWSLMWNSFFCLLFLF